MENKNTTVDSLNSTDFGKPALPAGLNVLTILTFIGSALQLLGVVFGYLNAQKSYDQKDKMLAQMSSGELPAWAKSFMPNSENYEEMLTKNLENKIPMLIIGLAAIALCVFGAMQMRKLKKQGFLIYLVGQILPFLTTALFVGIFMFQGVAFIIGSGLTILFILLYLTQRKHLIY